MDLSLICYWKTYLTYNIKFLLLFFCICFFYLLAFYLFLRIAWSILQMLFKETEKILEATSESYCSGRFRSYVESRPTTKAVDVSHSFNLAVTSDRYANTHTTEPFPPCVISTNMPPPSAVPYGRPKPADYNSLASSEAKLFVIPCNVATSIYTEISIACIIVCNGRS